MWKKIGDFVLGKGFYIVLFLCVATIGISGYYLLRTATAPGEQAEQTTGEAQVTLPDVSAPSSLLSQPAPSTADSSAQTEQKEETKGETKTDPKPEQTTKSTAAAASPEPEQAEPVVYTWPVKGEILRDYSVETLSLDPTLGDWRTHGGLDIASASGTQVLAMRAGTVAEVFDDGLMGITVVIDHGDGMTSTYCNLADRPTVQAGDKVKTGTVIGAVGTSAIAESGVSDHLHLETWMGEERVDPRAYLPNL
jgi:murein DD-endopeptidase MepM/ murein hydrolase activator NlpD